MYISREKYEPIFNKLIDGKYFSEYGFPILDQLSDQKYIETDYGISYIVDHKYRCSKNIRESVLEEGLPVAADLDDIIYYYKENYYTYDKKENLFLKVKPVLEEHDYFDNGIFELRPYYWGDATAIITKPNFVHKRTGTSLFWYKYPLRGAYFNFNAPSPEEFEKIINECIESLEGICKKK